jgi:thiamine biosynthesis lipoprotein
MLGSLPYILAIDRAVLGLSMVLSTMALVPLLLEQNEAPTAVEREAYLMGTRLRVVAVAPTEGTAMAAIEAAFSEVRRLEGLLSSWREDSEMSRLNLSVPGVPVEASAELLGILEEVQRWSERSGGAFDPAVGSLVEAWDLRGAGRMPTAAEIERALLSSGLDGFEFDVDNGTVTRLLDAVWMTAGGFGKGAALKAARRALRQGGARSATLDFGGQISVLGSPGDGGAWPVEVAHPSRRDVGLTRLRLRDRSAATSSASERFIEIDGVRYGHIVDPRSGWPVPAWGSVTVVAEDPLVADILATALFVLGPEEGLALAEDWTDIGVLLLAERAGQIDLTWNEAMEPWLDYQTEGL